MSHDLSTPEGRAARLADVHGQSEELDTMPGDTEEGLAARMEHHAAQDAAFAEVYLAEADVHPAGSVAYRAIRDAAHLREASAAHWRKSAEAIRSGIATAGEGDPR